MCFAVGLTDVSKVGFEARSCSIMWPPLYQEMRVKNPRVITESSSNFGLKGHFKDLILDIQCHNRVEKYHLSPRDNLSPYYSLDRSDLGLVMEKQRETVKLFHLRFRLCNGGYLG